MTTQETKTDLRLKIKEKSADQLVKMYENNQTQLKSGANLEEGLIINDVVVKEMENRLNKISFFTGGLLDSQIYSHFKSKI